MGTVILEASQVISLISTFWARFQVSIGGGLGKSSRCAHFLPAGGSRGIFALEGRGHQRHSEAAEFVRVAEPGPTFAWEIVELRVSTCGEGWATPAQLGEASFTRDRLWHRARDCRGCLMNTCVPDLH